MTPKLRSPVLDCHQRYLQIENPSPANFQVRREFSQTLPEPRSWSPEGGPATSAQGLKKTPCFLGRRWPPAAGGMRDHTPKFRNTGPRNSPTSGIGTGPLNCLPRPQVLRRAPALSVDEQVGVN